jgi:DNA-directed RNA polymerase specialized sigma24 family protein
LLSFYLSIVSSNEDKKLVAKLYFECKDTMTYVASDILKSRQKAEDAVHLENLSLTYHDTMYLSIIENLSIKKISKILKLPIETVKKRLQRGRKILIDELREVGIECSQVK